MNSKIISSVDEGRRLDNVILTTLKTVPRSLIYKLIRSGQVRINGKRSRPSDRVSDGDKIRIPPISQRVMGLSKASTSEIQHLEHCILHEDSQLIVINKPSGLSSHSGTNSQYGVIEMMRQARPSLQTLNLAHRLDKETSGCLVLCKDLNTLREVQYGFANGICKKEYIALLRGNVPEDLREISRKLLNIRQNSGYKHAVADIHGKAAKTLIKRKQNVGGQTFTRFLLETGRMHQIRAHCQGIGHPIAGDKKYGDSDFNKQMKKLGLKRLFLHSTFFALSSGKIQIEIEAPAPASLRSVLDNLENLH